MTLEGFCTSKEIYNGIVTPDRVKELVGVMQKVTDCLIDSISDSTHQWSAVARAIAATDNKECVLLFVQLDGLIYLNRWLTNASDFVNKTSDSCVEDTIIDLLRALSRIEADRDKLVASKVWMTVNDLLGLNNPKVRDMAKSVFEMWNKEKPRKDIGMTENTERVSEQYGGENGNLGSSNGDIDASRGVLTSEIQHKIDEEIKKTASGGAITNEDIPYSTNTKSSPEPENVDVDKLEPSSSCIEETPSAEACGVVAPEQGIQKEEINVSEFDTTRTEKLGQKMASSLQILDKEKDPKVTLSTNITGTLQSVTEPCDIKDDNAKENDSGDEVSNTLKTAASEDDEKISDDESSGYNRNSMAFRMRSGGKHNHNVLVPSNTSELKQKNHRKKYHSIEMNSDFDLDYGIADPLEIARMVANEVEREVEDRMEVSCSSSDNEMSSKVQQPDSSHSTTGEQCEAESSAAKVSTQPDLSLDSRTREDHVIGARGLDPGSLEARSPQVTKAAQAVETITDDGRCHFDLNQHVCFEDVEPQGDTMSTPVSIVSASRVPETSAFRPASPHRVPESNFALSACGNNTNLKGNCSLLNIDLNAAEYGDDKPIPESFQLASFESSAETSSRRSEVLEFDLNQISEDVAPLDLQLEQVLFCQRSGHQYESSSSSSSKQPSLRNVDLNDHPTVANDFSNDCFYLNPSQSAFAFGNVKSNDSVISIMGMRVEVNRRDSSIKPFPLPNGRVPEHPIGFNLEMPGSIMAMGSPASYAHHPHVFSLNGLPPGSSIPFHSPMYGYGGAIPHMVDSRGSSVVPQIMPSSAISSSFPQPTYLFAMPGMPSVNSGIYSEGSGRELGGFRQLFNPPQPRLFDEQMKVNSPHPSTSLDIGVGGKRKESENVWESYPFKHHQQPWR